MWRQVSALVRKDARIAIANKAASIIEIVVPMVVGCMVGLFIKMIQIVQGQAGEYSDLHPMPEPWASVGAIFAISNKDLSTATLSLSQYYAKYFAPGLLLDGFNSTNQMLKALSASPYGGFGISVHTPFNATFYSNMSQPDDWMYGSMCAMGKDLIASQLGAEMNLASTFEYTGVTVNLRAIFSSTGANFMLYAFLPALVLTAGRLVEEKRSRVRESLKVMGVGDFAYVLSNYISTTIRLTIGSGLATILPAFFSAYDLADIPAVFGISILLVLSLISYAHLMASIFSVSMWTNIGCIILLSVGAALASLSTGWPVGLEYLTCLLSPAAFYYALLPYMTRGTVSLGLSTGNAVMMLVVDAVIYGLLGNYIYQINPGDFGVPKHPLFFLNISKLFRSSRSQAPLPPDGVSLQANENENRIILDNLVKFYGSQRDVASVDHLSLKIRKGEIFALLGHNGAGKTTTISILTGMITATDYSEASVDGVDIHEGMDTIRKSIGLCPQFDVLFGDLTALQHLELFAEIKGLDRNCERVASLMSQLDLPYSNQKASTFSGGTKRRLSVGNALVGDPALVFLDEPSSGMDPLSRRKMWDLIKAERDCGKTVVLTTHFMEEADYLGDRIAIMASGKLFCCNTSSQLKDQYGVGYYLIFAKAEGMRAETNEMLSLLQQHIPEAKLHHESSGDSTFIVPISAIGVFPSMLREVEANISRMCFHSYGVSMNSLEDVFVSISEKVEEDKAQKKHAKEEVQATRAVHADSMLINGSLPEAIFQRGLKVEYWSRVRSQTMTIFNRKLKMLSRNRRMQLMVIAFPIIFIVLAFVTLQPTAPNSSNSTQSFTQPNYFDLHVVNLDLRDDEDNHKIRDAFRAVYETRYPGASLTIYDIDSFDAYSSGQYLPLKSVSFASGFNSPDIACGFLLHSVNLAQRIANYSFIVNNKFSSEVFVDLHQMYAASINLAAGYNVSTIAVTVQEIPTIGANETQAPQPNTNDPKLQTYNVIQLGIYLVISIVQLASNVAIPMADEINRQIYHVSRAQGLLPIAFFAGNFLFDLICAFIPVLVLGVAILIAGIPAYHSFGVLLAVLLAAFMFSIHAILDSYVLVSYVRNWKPVAYTGLLHAMNLAFLGAPYLVSVIIGALSDASAGTYKPWLLSLTPPASFYHIMDNAADMNYYTSTPSYILTLTGDVATGWGYLFLLAEYIVPVFLLYKFAKGDWPRSDHPTSTPKTVVNEKSSLLNPRELGTCETGVQKPLDADILDEQRKVEANPENYSVALSHVFKRFGDKVAVNDLTLGIRNGDCFGLLGPNGAGKSTTCHMILRYLMPSSGNVLFPGCGVDSNTPHQEAYDSIRMGMCTQGDTLWEYLDSVEHLDQFLRLRLTTEYKEQDWKEYILNTIERVQLDNTDKTHAGGYSGGMKRKLTVCLAMYTGSKLVFLDEPSTGMDPFARRALWSVILEALSNDRSVLLTTHSMEEADAVCGRISIITAGELRCIGSSQHLKSRFGNGYVLTLLREPEADDNAIDNYVAQAFGVTGTPNEILGLQRRYDLGRLNSLADAFAKMQEKKENLHISQYSISQTVSLEQIFLTFVSDSNEPAIPDKQ